MRTILNPVLNKPWRYSLIIGAFALFLPTALFITISDKQTLGSISNFVLLGYLVIAFAAYTWAAIYTKKISPKLTLSWTLLASSILWLVVAHSIWFVTNTLLGLTSYFLFVAFFYLLFYPTFWLGIYLLPKEKQSKWQRIRRLLDSMTILLGGLLLMWVLRISPSVRGADLNIETLLVGFLSPVSSFTMISTVIALVFSPRLEQPREPLILIGLACPMLIVADLDLANQVAAGIISSGTIGEYLWMIVAVLASLAAVLQATAVPNPPQKRVKHEKYWKTIEFIRVALSPLVLTLVFAVLNIYHHRLTVVDFNISSWGMWMLFGLVSFRQLMVMVENIDLSSALQAELAERHQAQSALQQVNQILEHRVMERTQKLVQVNEQLRQNEHKLRYDAFHDKLTGLSNRAFFTDYLQHLLHMTRSHPGYHFGILFLDFDSFKVINDSLGHLLGDEFLIALAQRLERCIDPNDLVARLGGDEFVVLLTDVRDIRDVQAAADKVQQLVRQPFDVEGHRLFTSVSIGIVLGDSSYLTAKDILRDADIAMYKAKDQGKSRSVIFNSSMRVMAMERLLLETELREALMRKEFFLDYQPIWDLREQRVAGFEALVRWQHPQRGVISPLQFIPIAEETGMIIALGEWVLEEACRQMKLWHLKFAQESSISVSVNISANQLRQSDLPTVVERILQKLDFSPACLKLEITESAFLYDIDAALGSFTKLKDLGLQLQLDDFGTGYSSLGYLHRLPITTLKIDRTFISRIDIDGQHIEIARAISTLAHNLRMSIIAEGVETEAQLLQVGSLECEQIQGYLIAKPLSVDDAERFVLAKRNPTLPLVEEDIYSVPEIDLAAFPFIAEKVGQTTEISV